MKNNRDKEDITNLFRQTHIPHFYLCTQEYQQTVMVAIKDF
ncbi:MAG: hypothetical protein RMJ53_05635 [Chitinophagales bacterium]|nr:hypothetical protein [Chitinophagales bacterium]MDW8273692.1 hypothetical protein [Chitinophagales bacterium]